jgi:dihydrodipicolinate synthase/N-acetylneuraminate lyase
VFIQGTSGESLSLTVKERKVYLEAWMKCTNVSNGKLKVF